MLFHYPLVSILFAITVVAEELVKQSHVPVLMWSHYLTPALHKYLAELDSTSELPLSTFFEAVEGLIEGCDASAFIFINQPGLRKHDFVEYEEEFVNLERYLRRSSTSIAFEKVELIPADAFDQLTEHVQEYCRIDKVIHVEDSNPDSFESYIDIEKRIIRVDCPPFPEDPELRREAIFKFDSNLRGLLAQVPSPAHSVIYTSLQPDKDFANVSDEIFPHIFRDKNRELPVERNHHELNIPPPSNAYRPKFAGMKEDYLSIFDAQFFQKNKELLFLIATSLFGYITFELMSSYWATSTTSADESLKSTKTIKTSPIKDTNPN